MNLFVNIRDVIELACLAVLLVLIFGVGLRTSLRQRRCKHDKGVGETQACDAICRECGKNLGFIGAIKAVERRQ